MTENKVAIYNRTDSLYVSHLSSIFKLNNIVSTRNSETYCHPFLDNTQFFSFPLVTVRRTAWKTALIEMEWFMSGDSRCPDKLRKWWEGQLNAEGEYLCGYSDQMRRSVYEKEVGESGYFDQVGYILNSLINHPNSRRMVMTTWNTGEMANITKTNKNRKVPSCCHGSITQLFVVNNIVHMKTYQRSADMLLGLPHNWVQYWALLQYFAYHSGREMGSLTWMYGDAHIYNEETHLSAANEMISSVDSNYTEIKDSNLKLVYKYSGEKDYFNLPLFKASDFSIDGTIPEPVVTIKPKLL